MSERKPRIMFLCTGNSCRSQIAEGFARHFGGDRVEVFSAGLEPHGLNPSVVAVMREAGMDYAITLCGNAEERCPTTPPHVKRLHWPFDDPAKGTGLARRGSAPVSRVREEIREKVCWFLDELGVE